MGRGGLHTSRSSKESKETRLDTTACPPSRPATLVCTAQKMLSSLSQEWELNVPELISNFALHLPPGCCHPPSGHLPSRAPRAAAAVDSHRQPWVAGATTGLVFLCFGVGILGPSPETSWSNLVFEGEKGVWCLMASSIASCPQAWWVAQSRGGPMAVLQTASAREG